MEEIFQSIVKTFSKYSSISTKTKQIQQGIQEGKYDIAEIYKLYLDCIINNGINENNKYTINIIREYLEGKINLEELSSKLFRNKIIIDDDKRESSGGGEFYHSKDETFFDETLRVLYEFTRPDKKNPKGVCFDFCLFIAALSIMKQEPNELYLWNSIERKSGENNFVLFIKSENSVKVFDPFNDIYIPIENYDLVYVGFKIINLKSNIFFQESQPHTGFFVEELTTFKDVKKLLNPPKFNDGKITYETMKEQDYYTRLGIIPTATFDEIKSAFRNIAKKTHSDVCDDPEADQKMQLLLEAYNVLKDDNLRKHYDEVNKFLTATQTVVPENTNQEETTIIDELERKIRDFERKYGKDIWERIIRNFVELEEVAILLTKYKSQENIYYGKNINPYEKNYNLKNKEQENLINIKNKEKHGR